MKRVLALLLTLLLAPTAAHALSYYFSDCGWTPQSASTERYWGDACGGANLIPGALPEGTADGGASCTVCVPGQDAGLCAEALLIAIPGSRQDPWCLSPALPVSKCTAAGLPYGCCTGVGTGPGCTTSRRSSFEILMDGVDTGFNWSGDLNKELAAGDTVELCAGPCDGGGSATFYLQPHAGVNGALPVFDAAINATTASPITIRPYCNAALCEKVTLSGDSNNNGVYEPTTDAGILFDTRTSASSGKTGYVFNGDPGRTQTCFPGWTGPMGELTKRCGGEHLIIEKFGHQAFYLAYADGESISITGTEIRYVGAGNIGAGGAFTSAYFNGTVGDGGFIDIGVDADTIDASLDSYAVFIVGHLTNSIAVTVQENYIHNNAAIAFRYNGNCDTSQGGGADPENCSNGPSSILIDQNVLRLNEGIGDGHEGRNMTWSNNAVSDWYQGLGIENQMRGITIKDNIFGCSGDGTLRRSSGGSYGKCGTAVWVTDNNNAGTHCDDVTVGDRCVTYDINIQRNRIFGERECTGGAAACPDRVASTNYLVGGIVFDAHNAVGSINGGNVTTLIENNIVEHTQKSSGCSSSSPEESPIAVRSIDAVTVQNNTLFDNSCPMLIGDGQSQNGGGAGVVAHTVTSNLVDQARGYGASGIGNSVEMLVLANADTSLVTYNDLYYGNSGSGNVATISGAGYSCSEFDTWDEPGGTSGTNICAVATFVDSSSSTAKALWDLHLSGVQACMNSGIAGSASDIDSLGASVRPNQSGPPCSVVNPSSDCSDIGADEYAPSGAPVAPPDPLPDIRSNE